MNEQTTPEKPQKPRGGVQPKKQASKSKVAVKQRRKKIIKAILEGKTQQEAGIIAGFSPKTASAQVTETLKNPKIQNALISAMEKDGISDSYLAQKLRALIEGTKVISAVVIAPGSENDPADAGSMTKDFIEVPDNVALAKGIEIACKIKGQFAPEKHDINEKRSVTVIIRRFGPDDGDATP